MIRHTAGQIALVLTQPKTDLSPQRLHTRPTTLSRCYAAIKIHNQQQGLSIAAALLSQAA